MLTVSRLTHASEVTGRRGNRRHLGPAPLHREPLIAEGAARSWLGELVTTEAPAAKARSHPFDVKVSARYSLTDRQRCGVPACESEGAR